MRRRTVLREHHAGMSIHRRWHYVPSTQSAANRGVYELSLIAGGLTAIPAVGRPDAVLGVTPTLSGAILAMVAGRVLRCPYGLLVHDLMGRAAQQSGVSGGQRVTAAVQWAEFASAKGARAIGIIAEGFRRYFEDAGVPASRIYRLRTWTLGEPPAADVSNGRHSFGWSEGQFICLHGGNMGHKQDLDNVLDAADSCGDPTIRVVLAGEGNDRRRLEDRARQLHLDGVSFLPPQPWGRYEEMLQVADLLLVNQRSSVGDMSLPSKLTSYFAAGRPVVAAVAPDSETAHEIRRAEAGVVVPPGDPKALADALSDLRRQPRRLAELGANAKRYADDNLSAEVVLREYQRFAERLAEHQR